MYCEIPLLSACSLSDLNLKHVNNQRKCNKQKIQCFWHWIWKFNSLFVFTLLLCTSENVQICLTCELNSIPNLKRLNILNMNKKGNPDPLWSTLLYPGSYLPGSGRTSGPEPLGWAWRHRTRPVPCGHPQSSSPHTPPAPHCNCPSVGKNKRSKNTLHTPTSQKKTPKTKQTKISMTQQ